jgi:hypothetical protein
MKSDRGSRLDETRNTQTREHEIEKSRPSKNLTSVSMLHIPDVIKKDKFEYYWGRRGLKSAYDSSLDILFSSGWRPVERNRDPNTFMIGADSSDPVYNKYYCKGDAILLEREEELGIEERERNVKKAIDNVTQSQVYQFDKNNPTATVMKRAY